MGIDRAIIAMAMRIAVVAQQQGAVPGPEILR
jgi:hypothetical protein